MQWATLSLGLDRMLNLSIDVVLETRVLVSRRRTKIKVLVLDHEVLVLVLNINFLQLTQFTHATLHLVSVLKKKSCSFSRLLL